ncbi:MAG: hypothetical protein AAF939_19335, partial [Planctomycetota bacterium]
PSAYDSDFGGHGVCLFLVLVGFRTIFLTDSGRYFTIPHSSSVIPVPAAEPSNSAVAFKSCAVWLKAVNEVLGSTDLHSLVH